MSWEHKTKRSAFEVAALVLCALPILYGVKCLITLQATLPFPRKWTYGFNVQHVTGWAAAWTGLGWIALGAFANLSIGSPPPESRGWLWRVVRWLARWGSFAGFWLCWDKANALMNNPLWPLGTILEMLRDYRFALCLAPIVLLWFLFAMYRREAVKRELLENGCQPLHIWWQPGAYWAIWPSRATPFRVVYRDAEGATHKAYCYVYRRLLGPVFGPRCVRWLQDEIVSAVPQGRAFLSAEA